MFGLGTRKWRQKCWIYAPKYTKMQWSWKESNGLERTIYVPYFDRIACIFNKNWGKWSWKKSKVPLLLPCDGRIEQKWWNMQGIWPNWLPTVGHTLAMTHVYNLKYTSLRLRMVFLCVHGPLPDPWRSWALIEPIVCMKILSSCSYPPGQWCNLWTLEKWAFLFSFSLTGLSLLMPWEEQVQRCHHCLIYKYK